MKSVKKKLLMASAMALAACSCFALTACKGKQPHDTTPEAFGAPENVTVVADTLSWGSVDGATNGYTVKINSDETTTVSVNELDLTTVTGKFSSGSNTLSVKVNAVGDKLESEYSTTVTYTYTPGSVTPDKFATPTVTLTNDILSWNQIAGAVQYTVKINSDETTVVSTTSLDLTTVTAKLKHGDNTLSVKVNATANISASEYSAERTYNYADPDRVAAEAFTSLVGAIDISAATAETNLAAAKTAYGALSATAKTLVADSYASLKTKDANYFIALVGKIEETVTTASRDTISNATAYYELLLDKNAASILEAKTTLQTKQQEYLALFTAYTNEYKSKFNVQLPNDPAGTDIDDVAAAIAAAEAYYTEQSSDADVKAALDIVKNNEFNAYKQAFDAAVKAEYDGYVSLLTEVEGVVEEANSLADLNAKLDELIERGEEMSQVNVTVITADAELYGRIEAVMEVPEEWEAAIATKKAELKLLIKKIANENAKTANIDYALILSSCENAQSSLAGYLSEGVADEIETLENNAEAAKTAIEGQVEATIAGELRDKLAAVNAAFGALTDERNATTVAALKAAYAEFESSYRKLDRLGAYAKNYFDTEVKISSGSDDLLTDAIDEMKATVLAIAVETVAHESVSCEGTGGAYITVSRSYVNCRGEALLLATAPVLTVDATDSGDTGAHIRTGFDLTANADNVYVAQIVLDNMSKIATARYQITGGLDEESYISLNYELNMGNPWFTGANAPAEDTVGVANGYKTCLQNGKVAITKAGNYENFYLAVYEADKVVKDTGSYMTFTDAPLATIDVTSEGSLIELAKLRSIIALNAPYVVGNTYDVRFVIYGVGTNEGKAVHSKFDPSVVSQLVTLQFTEDDLAYGQVAEEEKVVPIGLPNGWHLHRDGNANEINYPWEVESNKDEKVSEVKILIYDATYILGDAADYDFADATPLATYTIPAGGGWINWDTLGTAIRAGWAELPNDNKLLSHKLVLAMQAVSNDAEYANSKLVYATDSEGNREIEEFDMRMQIGINGVIDGGYNGNLYVAVAGNIPNFVTQFENQAKLVDSSIYISHDMAGANEYLEVIVRVYDHDDDAADRAPLFEYKSAFVDNFSANVLVSAWANEYFAEHSDEATKTYNVDFAFAIGVKDEATELKDYFIVSNEQLGQNSAQNVEITLTNPNTND